MINAVDRQMTLLWLIRKNNVIKNFKSGLYFLLRGLCFNLFHLFDQVGKHSVSKTFKKKVGSGQPTNSAYVKCFCMGMLPRLNNFLRAPFYVQRLGNIIS